jgi:hypothetical protein
MSDKKNRALAVQTVEAIQSVVMPDEASTLTDRAVVIRNEIWSLVEQTLAGTEDAVALIQYKKRPESTRRWVEDVIIDLLEQNTDFAQQLDRMLDEYQNEVGDQQRSGIHIGGDVGPGAVIGGGSVRADNIAGGDINIGGGVTRPGSKKPKRKS